MPTLADATMAKPGDKTSQFQPVPITKKSKKVKDGITTEGVVNYSYNYPMRILMTAPKPSTKTTYNATYNPIPKTKRP